MRGAALAAAIVCAAGTAGTAAQTTAQLSDREIVARSQLFYGDPGGMEITLHVVDTNISSNSTATLDLNVRTRGNDVLVTYLAPRASRGEKLLIKDRNIWFVSHNYQKAIAISPRQRRFGAAAYSDIASKDLADQYTINRLPDETVDGVRCDVFDLRAAPTVSFSHVRFSASKDGHVPVAARFESVSQNVSYDVKYETRGTIDRGGRAEPFVSRITISGVDTLTALEYSKVRQKQFPPSEFDPSRLQHGINTDAVRRSVGAVLAGAARDVETDVRAVTYVDAIGPSLTNQNPDNLLFNIEHTRPMLTLRPNFSYRAADGRISLAIRPRFELGQRRFDVGAQAGETLGVDRAYVNEYWIAVRELVPKMTFTLKRDNQQWGPAYLGSPSNLFFPINGRTRPLAEIHGTDFGTIAWIPTDHFGVSYIDNFRAGAQTPEDFAAFGTFERARAVKVDLSFSSSAMSVVIGDRSNDRAKYGVYGQWTAADALLVYFDTTFRRGSSALYPTTAPGSPVGGSFDQTRSDSSTVLPEMLGGLSYTTKQNVTMYGEYLYYARGYTGEEARDFSTLVDNASALVRAVPPTPLTGLGYQTLGEAYFNGLRWRGRHHLMFQVTKSFRGLALVSHSVMNPLDRSGFTYAGVTASHKQHEFFVTAQRYFGGRSTEYRAILNHLFTVGYQVMF